MIKLLCIDAKFNRISLINPLREGSVYTFLEDVTCSCGKSPGKCLTVLEQPFVKPRILRCHFCQAPRRFTYRPFRASRFIQLNDPDLQTEEVLEKELILAQGEKK